MSKRVSILQWFTQVMLDDYYDEREWDIETGRPTREKLAKVGLKDVADDVDKSNSRTGIELW